METKVTLSIMALVFVGMTNLMAQVTVYKSNNYTGEKLDIPTNWSAVGTPWNDRTMSVKVPTGYKVTLYEHTQAGKPAGNSKVIYSDWVVEGPLAGKVSNIVVESIPKIVLYKTNNFTGENIALTDNWSSQVDFNAWNDKIKSIKIPAGYKIIIYEHDASRGKSLELTSDWVADANWSDKISNITVVSKPK